MPNTLSKKNRTTHFNHHLFIQALACGSRGKRFFLAAFAVGLIQVGFFSQRAQAIVMPLTLTDGFQVDRNTGNMQPNILNPEGIVDIKFGEHFLDLQYKTSREEERSIRIHIEVEGLKSVPPESRTLALAIYDRARTFGPQYLANILGQIVTSAQRENRRAFLKLDTTGTIGFLKTDFDLADTKLVIANGPTISLIETLISTFEAELTPKKQPAQKPNNRAQTPNRSALGSCEASFLKLT